MPAAVLDRRRSATWGADKLQSDDLVSQLQSMRAEGERLRSLIARRGADQPAKVRGELERLVRTVHRLQQEFATAAAANEEFPEAAKAARDMIAKGELLDPVAFAERLKWTKQALSKALAARRVFFIEFQGARYFPAFYADRRQERRHLEAVTKIMGDLPGSSKLQFFTTARGSLSRMTPLQALQRGLLAEVKNAAADFAEG